MAEPLEAGVREQRLDSMRETAGTLPTGGVFVPFSDVVERFSWTPDAAVEARRGIGSVDALSHDTGPESHSVTIAFLMQGAMVEAATLATGGTAHADQITWTASKAGHDGNEISVTLLAAGSEVVDGGISVIDKDIICEVGTALPAASAVAADFVTMVNANVGVAAIATLTAVGAGTVQSAGKASLTNGVSTPLSEAFNRDDDGQIEARTIVLREKHYEGGVVSYGLRTYVVLEGCKPASARIPGAPGDAGPIVAEITYTAEKGRQYEISQPSTECVVAIVSSDASDLNTTATVTVEDDDGAQQPVPITGTSTQLFKSIDALELDGDCTGTVQVLQGGTAGATLAAIYGKQEYANAEGDRGVPVIPSGGSRSGTVYTGSVYEKFLGDTIVRDSGTLAYDINSVELSVDNSVEAIPRSNTRKQRILEGNRVLQLTATVLGEAEYQRQITRHLQLEAADIAWTLTGSTLTLEGARLTSIGDKTVEAGQAFMSIDNTFEGTAITIA